MKPPIDCPTCKGDGEVSVAVSCACCGACAEDVPCDDCDGDGRARCVDCPGPKALAVVVLAGDPLCGACAVCPDCFQIHEAPACPELAERAA